MSRHLSDCNVFKQPDNSVTTCCKNKKNNTDKKQSRCKTKLTSSNKGFLAERRLTRSSSKVRLQREADVLPQVATGVLTRNRSRLLESQGNICEFYVTRSESGYGTSSDASRDCAESVGSSVGSGRDSLCLSDSIKSWDETVSSTKSPVDTSTTIAQSPDRPQGPSIIYLQEARVKALIPNLHSPSSFTLHVDHSRSINRELLGCSMRVHHISPVVRLTPYTAEFSEDNPALIIIPLRVEPRDEGWLHCLYTTPTEPTKWKKLSRREYSYRNSTIVVTARRLGWFTAIVEEPYPEILKKIRCRTGGRLRIPDVPGIEVNFPRGCLEQDINACLRVLFDNEPSLDNNGEDISQMPLASPIISLGPHGLSFNEDRLPVLISLPIPDYQDIRNSCPDARLIAYESSTNDDEPLVWQRIPLDIPEPNVIAYRHGISGVPIPIVTFPVYHFSFFKVVWELLSSTLYEAKMGVSYFYPYISFSMMCQAFMEESNENNRFGLEVICYRSDRKLPETTNYRHRVGASLKPKLVRPGRIIVRLRSQMFEADVEAGEDTEMVKEEPDFRGRDFEKQYACKFRPDSNVERGPFGKVIVERMAAKTDPLFEFNLHKTGVESLEMPSTVGNERWTVFAMKELASSLLITENNNWKAFAKYIGFTKSEIKNKLTYSADPFLALMNMYNSRGGTPEEFIQALYVVSRDIRLGRNDAGSPASNSSRSSNQSGGSGSHDSGAHSQDSNNSPTKRLWRFPWGNHESDFVDPNLKDLEQGPSGSGNGSGRKRSKPSTAERTKSGPSDCKRRRFSDASETIQSSSEEDEVKLEDLKSVSTEKHRNNPRKLADSELWRISKGIARKDWRNLGRSLGIEEITLGNLEHAHQSFGFRECAYQMLLEWKGQKPKKCTFGELFAALNREKMASVAKFMVRKIANSEEEKGRNSDSS